MAYDKQAAHEYYENYTKKGKKKGRAKGKGKKKSSTTRIVGLTQAGLNDAGKMEFALMKEKLQSEMNSALKNAKTEAEKNAIRMEYQNRALQEISKIKSNPNYAKPSSSKTSGSKSSGGSSKSKGSSSSGSSKSSSGSSSQSAKVDSIKNEISNLTAAVKNMDTAQKEKVRTAVNQIIEKIKSMTGVNTDSLISSLSKITGE